MKKMQWQRSFPQSAVFLILPFMAGNSGAQQQGGKPCSPAKTETLDSKYLLAQPAPFGGEADLNASTSKPCWPPRVVPPKGAPNILLVMTDDVGFGAPSIFGVIIPTPALDDRDYKGPFKFTGKIDKLTIKVRRPQLTPTDIQKLKEAKASASDAR